MSAYGFLVENAGVAIGEIDRDGCWLTGNRELSEILGASGGLAPGARLDAFWPQTVVTRVIERVDEAIASGIPVRHDDTVNGRALSLTMAPSALDAVIVIVRGDEDEVRAQHGRQARLIERVMAAQEAERRHLARELHDQAGSSLAAMLLTCHAMRDASSLAEARAAAGRLAAELTSTLDDLARLARGLHPIALEQVGLAPALTRGIASIARGSQLQVDFIVDLGERRIATGVEVALFRIAQEAVTNVIRHAQARSITLRCRLDNHDVVLAIRDDGRGFDVHEVEDFVGRGRLGLAGIRDRAALLGGTTSIETSPGHGTTIRVRIPLPHGEPGG